MQIDDNLARAIARDTANKQMKKAKRLKWNQKDFNLATQTYLKLIQSTQTGV